MAEDHRSPGSNKIYVLAAFSIGDPASRGALNESRGSPDRSEGANRAVDASRKELASNFEQILILGATHHHSCRVEDERRVIQCLHRGHHVTLSGPPLPPSGERS